jgi:hypothetical protein
MMVRDLQWYRFVLQMYHSYLRLAVLYISFGLIVIVTIIIGLYRIDRYAYYSNENKIIVFRIYHAPHRGSP